MNKIKKEVAILCVKPWISDRFVVGGRVTYWFDSYVSR